MVFGSCFEEIAFEVQGGVGGFAHRSVRATQAHVTLLRDWRLKGQGSVAGETPPLASFLQLLFLLNSLSPDEVGVGRGIDVLVLEEAHGAVDFKNADRDLVIVADAVLAHGALEFVHADVFFGHVGFDDLAVVDEHAGLALNELAEAAIGAR